MRDAFSDFHPLTGFLFFALVLGVSMCVLHPLTVAVSLITALCYYACLRGAEALGRLLPRLLPLLFCASRCRDLRRVQKATPHVSPRSKPKSQSNLCEIVKNVIDKNMICVTIQMDDMSRWTGERPWQEIRTTSTSRAGRTWGR